MQNIKFYPNNRDEFVGAETLMKWLHGRTSGVFAADGTAAVSAVQNKMAVSVSDGYGWITDAEKNGVVWWIDNSKTTGQPLELAIDSADGVMSRIDRIIVEWNTANYTEYPIVKVLKGDFSSNPTAPDIKNTTSTRRLSLARILIPAGTTSITPGLITDERLDKTVCGIVTYDTQFDTSVIQAQFESILKKVQSDTQKVLDDTQSQSKAVLQSINDELKNIQSGSGVELAKLMFTDTVIPISSFTEDSTSLNFPYRGTIELPGVISNMVPDIIFSEDDAMSGNYSPVARPYNGGVYIYAASPPDGDLTIPTIILWRGNENA